MTKEKKIKAVLKENPIAMRTARQTSEYTITDVEPYDRYVSCLDNGERLVFVIPHVDQGDKLFEKKVESKLLINWLC